MFGLGLGCEVVAVTICCCWLFGVLERISPLLSHALSEIGGITTWYADEEDTVVLLLFDGSGRSTVRELVIIPLSVFCCCKTVLSGTC